MKVFIIGGTGLLGSEAAKVLIERGHEVTAIALPPLPAGAELPSEMKIEFGNYLEMTDEELRAQFTGTDALIFAAGVNERVEAGPPIYDLYRKYNIEPVRRLFGIAKACGVKNPTVGILNVDGARQTEMALNTLKDNGYEFEWATSARADGGAVLRGNDVLKGTPDVLICDSLTGNVLVKMLSAYTTGGSFEATGYGYGPGIGPGYDKLVLIVSRASGAPLVANALEFGAQLVKGKVFEIAEKEFAAAEKAGLSKLLADRKAAAKGAAAAEEEVKAPPAEPCTASIPGIEVMDLEDAAKVLWKAGIYAETGMGCTGPLVMMSDANHAKAVELLKAAGYIG